MGEKNQSGVRAELRGDRKMLVIDFRFKDKDGREQRYRRDASVQSMAGARAEAARLKRLAAEKGTLDAEAPVPTFATYVRDTFVPLVMPRFKPSTREGYEQHLDAPDHGLVALLGKKRLDAIGAGDARAVEADALGRKARARYALVCMRSVLRSAVELEVLAAMPRLPKLPARSAKFPDAPSATVVEQLLMGADGCLNIAIELAAEAGLRSGEVRALEVRDVDLEGGRLYVRRAYSADEVVEPKGRDERIVPLAPAIAVMLAGAIAGRRPTDRVVRDRRGRTPTEGALGGMWRRLQARLGIQPRWHYHQLRHFFATSLLKGGANVEVVRRLLGHKDLASTTRYVHATERDLVAAVALLPGKHGETLNRPCH